MYNLCPNFNILFPKINNFAILGNRASFAQNRSSGAQKISLSKQVLGDAEALALETGPRLKPAEVSTRETFAHITHATKTVRTRSRGPRTTFWCHPTKWINSFLRRSSAGARRAPRTCSHAGEKSLDIRLVRTPEEGAFEFHLFVRRKKGLFILFARRRK